MNIVRKRILENTKPYMDFSKCRDLVAFDIGADYFTYDHETYEELEADFVQVIVAVEKEWLFELMKADDIENPLDYLQHEYTWDDSIEWFRSAQVDGKIVVIEFN